MWNRLWKIYFEQTMLIKVDLSNLMLLKITTINKIRNKLRKDTESLPGEQIPQGFLEVHKLQNIYFDKTKTSILT